MIFRNPGSYLRYQAQQRTILSVPLMQEGESIGAIIASSHGGAAIQ